MLDGCFYTTATLHWRKVMIVRLSGRCMCLSPPHSVLILLSNPVKNKNALPGCTRMFFRTPFLGSPESFTLDRNLQFPMRTAHSGKILSREIKNWWFPTSCEKIQSYCLKLMVWEIQINCRTSWNFVAKINTLFSQWSRKGDIPIIGAFRVVMMNELISFKIFRAFLWEFFYAA